MELKQLKELIKSTITDLKDDEAMAKAKFRLAGTSVAVTGTIFPSTREVGHGK